MITVLLADDQAMVREALATLLSLEADIEVVGQTGSGLEVIAAVDTFDPDVVLLDIEMPGRTGIELAADLRDRRAAVLIVTTFGRPGYVQRALAAGASGFVVKDAPAAQLADAVRRVHRGERAVDSDLAMETLAAGEDPLTERERDVLRAGADGGTVADIARRVHLSQGTVRNHLSSAIGKLHARTRAEAVRIAQDSGWL